MEEKSDENQQNGDIFDRDAYLKNVEEFEDVEIAVTGRAVSKVNRKYVSKQSIKGSDYFRLEATIKLTSITLIWKVIWYFRGPLDWTLLEIMLCI